MSRSVNGGTDTPKNYVRSMSYTVKRLLDDSPETSIYVPLFCPISQYMFRSVTPFRAKKEQNGKCAYYDVMLMHVCIFTT
jgi:hypothetical protein